MQVVEAAGASGIPEWARWLVRPLAEDEHRARFWVRHVRIGVVLSEVTALVTLGYVPTSEHGHRGALAALFVVVMAATPLMMALPVERIARSRYGVLLPTTWSLSLIVVITTAALLDGGGRSPLLVLLFLTLAFAGLAYPPAGVTLLGSLMVCADLLALSASSEPLTPTTLLQPGALGVVTAMTAWAAGNHWDTYDRQLALAERLATLVAVDELTGALTRRGLFERLDGDLPQHGEHTLLVVDLDGFKLVNDTSGHEEGNEALVVCAEAIRAAIRSTDAFGRTGGDEFAVLLPHTPLDVAAEVAEHVRRAIADAGARWGVTASIGAAARSGPTTARDLIVAADAAMYEAKRAGRNRVITAATCSRGHVPALQPPAQREASWTSGLAASAPTPDR